LEQVRFGLEQTLCHHFDELSFPMTVNSKKAKLQGDCLLIPAAGESYNGTAFDEYLMVELYTPDGLNASMPNQIRFSL
jgi:hypothetical protein